MWTALMAVFAAIIGGITTAVNINSQKETNQQNLQAAKEMQEQQQVYARENAATANAETERMYWELYSPMAKVQQYKDAGLSTGLMYGGSGTGGTTAQMAAAPTQAAPYLNPPIMGNVMDQITSALSAASQAQLNKANEKKSEKETEKTDYEIGEIIARTKKTEEEAKTQVVTRNFTATQNELAKLQLNFETASFDDRLEIITNEKEMIRNNILKTQREIHGLDISNEYSGKLYQSTLDLNKELKNKYIAEQVYTAAQTELAEAQKALAYAQANKANKEVEQIELEMRKLTVIVEEYEANGYKFTEANGVVDNALGAIKHTHSEIQRLKEEGEWKWEGDGFYNRKGEKLGRKTPGGGATW